MHPRDTGAGLWGRELLMCTGILYESREIWTCADLARLIGQSNVVDEDGWIWCGDSCLCAIDVEAAFQRAGRPVEWTDDLVFRWADPAEAARLREFNARMWREAEEKAALIRALPAPGAGEGRSG